MPPQRISDLLPLADPVAEPHAYQVFGLEAGEQDSRIIAQAVKSTVNRLKSAKPDTPKQLWNEAARLVQSAQQVLADPVQKAELDARFGIVAVDPGAASPHPAGSHRSTKDSSNKNPSNKDPLSALLPANDPLARVLPSSDPLAHLLPAADPLDPVSQPSDSAAPHEPPPPKPLAPGLFGTPAEILPEDSNAKTASPESRRPVLSQPVVSQSGHSDDLARHTDNDSDSQRPPVHASDVLGATSPAKVVVEPKQVVRRKSAAGPLVMASVAIGMLGLIGLLGYFLFFGPGEVAITQTDGRITISTQPTPGSSTQRDTGDRRSGSSAMPAPRGAADATAVDGEEMVVEDWGDLEWGDEPPGVLPSATDGNPGSRPKTSTTRDSSPPESSDTRESLPPESSGSSDTPAPSNTPTSIPQPESMTPESMTSESMTSESISAGDQILNQLARLVRQSKWTAMPDAIETATQAELTAEQREQVDDYRNLVDLADRYRQAILRATEKLEVGSTLEVAEGLPMFVVESGDDLLVIRYAGKQKRLTTDQYPFTLAHHLAAGELNESPSTEAARAVYQAVAARSNSGYRDQALQWLQQLEGTIDDIAIGRIRQLIETLFDEDA